MDASTLQQQLDDAGEVMIQVEEFDEPIALHLHDTEIGTETIHVELADGKLTVALDAVTGFWIHKHSLGHYGLE